VTAPPRINKSLKPGTRSLSSHVRNSAVGKVRRRNNISFLPWGSCLPPRISTKSPNFQLPTLPSERGGFILMWRELETRMENRRARYISKPPELTRGIFEGTEKQPNLPPSTLRVAKCKNSCLSTCILTAQRSRVISRDCLRHHLFPGRFLRPTFFYCVFFSFLFYSICLFHLYA